MITKSEVWTYSHCLDITHETYVFYIRITILVGSAFMIYITTAIDGKDSYVCTKYWPFMQWASYQIRKIAGCACAGNAGNVFPCRRFQRKPLVSDPGMHHGTCVTHVPWCMSGSLTCGDRENVPGIPGACAPAILRIWQEAHENWCITWR